MEFIKFPSIEQFRNVIESVKYYCNYHTKPLPTLTFTGTIKIHGTNSAISYSPITNEYQYQSRERILSLTSDNCGFMLWGSQDRIKNLVKSIADSLSVKESIYIYGEWAGKGVQAKVAVSNIDKKFYIFKIIVDGKTIPLEFLDINLLNDDNRDVYSILEFDTYKIDIDFTNPQMVQNELVELTINIENECPVGKYFLSSLPNYHELNHVGEGIVWSQFETDLRFKVKGERHQSSKVKTLKQIANTDTEKFNNMREFIDGALSENRLNQGLDKLTEMGLDNKEMSSLGVYIKWCVGDVLKEEADTIVQNQFNTKSLGGIIATKARQFYINRI